VARGGSWRDVPKRSTASYRLSYWPYQSVYNVGFRVMCEIPDSAMVKNFP
jgi:formylglycine-generating enzyme required for sulfatase activity